MLRRCPILFQRNILASDEERRPALYDFDAENAASRFSGALGRLKSPELLPVLFRQTAIRGIAVGHRTAFERM
jgi:hypothetical protein